MERPELKLVTSEPARAALPAAALWGAGVLAAAIVATMAGADAARRPFDPASVAESALAGTLATGDPGPADDALLILRSRLAGHPLDAASRAVAASLAVETAESAGDLAAAAGQAQAAIRSAPVDEHVAHGAARILARCGRSDLALLLIARMFDYHPNEAAATLSDVEPFVSPDRLEGAIKDSADAWLAWSIRLRMQGKDAEADRRLAATVARWPDDLPALKVAASVAASRERMDDLVRLVPPSRSLPGTPDAAPLYAFRARSKALSGDAAGAKADAALAVSLSGAEPWVLAMAGDAVASNSPAVARDYWTRALYGLAANAGTSDTAIWLRRRLARLDEREGRAGDALREWRTILAARPGDAEAKRRVLELTGESSR